MSVDPCILGADPGLSGGVAFYYPDTRDVAVLDMPVVAGEVNMPELARQIRIYGPKFAFVERVASRPGQGVSSVFRFGCAYGQLLGVIATLEVPYRLVTPSTWKRWFKLSGSDKELSRARALELWPQRAELFKRKMDHGRAEAALLALYGADTL